PAIRESQGAFLRRALEPLELGGRRGALPVGAQARPATHGRHALSPGLARRARASLPPGRTGSLARRRRRRRRPRRDRVAPAVRAGNLLLFFLRFLAGALIRGRRGPPPSRAAASASREEPCSALP